MNDHGFRTLGVFAFFLVSYGAGWLHAAPPTPSALTSGTPVAGRVDLDWAPDSAATPAVTGYVVYRQLQDTQTPTGTPFPTATPVAVGTVLMSAIPSPGTPVLTDSQVTNGRVYLYQVAGVDGNGEGSPATVLAYPYSVPSAIYPVTVKNIHNRALDLAWKVPDASFPVSYYQVFRFGLTTQTPTPTGTRTVTAIPMATMTVIATPIGTTSANSFGDAGADPSAAIAYYYYVMAFDVAGNRSAFPPFSTDPGVPVSMGLPGPVTVNASISLSPFGMNILWNGSLASEQVSAYQVVRDGTPIATVVYAPGTPTVTYLDNTVQESKFGVVYGVQAVNPNGTTSSDPVTQYLIPATGGSVTVTPSLSGTAVTVSWAPALAGNLGVAGYRIYKGPWGPPTVNPTPGATQTPTPTAFATVAFSPSASWTLTPVVDSSLQDHTGYWVQPVDGGGQGGSIGIPSPPYFQLAPTPPTNLQVAQASSGNNAFDLTWNSGNPGFYGTPDHYALYRSVRTVVLTQTPTGTVSPTATPVLVATVPYGQNSTSDVVSNFSQGSTVVYQLGLVDPQGNLSDLLTASNAVTLGGSVNPPVAPSVLPFAGSDQSIRYSWLLNPGADAVTAYRIYGNDWAPGSSVTPVAILTNPSSTPTFAPTPSPWVPNVFFVVAQNAISTSAPATLAGLPVGNYTVSAVVPVGTQAVSLTWNSLPPPSVTPGITGYRIYRSLASTSGFTSVATVPYPVPGYEDVPPVATAGVTYYYRVVASGPNGAESPLLPDLTPDPYANVQVWPNPPSGVTVQSMVAQTGLGWSPNPAGENVLSYVVYRNGTPTMTVTPSPPLSLVFSESAGDLSVYQVAALNPSGSGNLSQPISVLVPPAMTPTIEWTPPPTVTPDPTPAVWISGLTYGGGVHGYDIYRQVTVTGTPSLIGNVPSPNSYFEDPDPIPGFINRYQVVANNGSGFGSEPSISAALAVTLWPAKPVFSANGGSAGMTLDWDAPAGDAPVTSWDIYRSVYPTTTPTFIATVVGGGQTFVDPDVTPGAAYVYQMNGQNASGAGVPSAPGTALAVDPPVLAVTPLADKNFLVWTVLTPPPGSPVSGYSIYRALPSPTPQFNVLAPLVEPLTNTGYVDTVTNGSTYLYKVAGSSTNGILGGFSNVVTQFAALQPVSILTAVSGDRLVQLRWNYQGVNTITYTLQKKLGTAPDGDFQTVRSGLTGTNYVDSDVADKEFYVYRLYSVDAGGNTSTSCATALALPAKPPVVNDRSVSLSQNTTNLQTLIGNSLSWKGADQAPNYDPASMYPLGGYTLSRSTDGGGVYQVLATLPVTLVNGVPASTVTYFDEVPLVNGSTNTYLVQAFDAPPDLPVPLAQAVTEGWVHTTSYDPVVAHSITPNTALDRNAIRPFGASNEQVVNIRFVVSNQGHVTIKVYNLGGTYITQLVDADYSPGIYWASWDAHNRFGALVASGVYLITTESPGHQEFSKVAVIK
ncbi:MAG TPA: hypothetical protein VHE12_14610 [bacterium]|nr:hypothetical protein [bacterium]